MAKIPERILDKRVARRYLEEGELAQSDWTAHLDKLPDDEATVKSVTSRPGRSKAPSTAVVPEDADDFDPSVDADDQVVTDETL